MKTVMAAVDGREHGLDAVARAREIAEAVDARLLVVHVAEKQMPYWTTERNHQTLLRHRLARIFEDARQVGGPHTETRMIDSSSVIEALIAAADEEQAGVLVVGSTHYGPVGHAVYGDIAKQLERRCDCRVEVARTTDRCAKSARATAS